MDNLLLFLHNNIVCVRLCPWKKSVKLRKLYSEGRSRILKDLNLVKLVRNLKRMKNLMKNSLMTKQIEFELVHNFKNVIDIDSAEQENDDASESFETESTYPDGADSNESNDNNIIQN